MSLCNSVYSSIIDKPQISLKQASYAIGTIFNILIMSKLRISILKTLKTKVFTISNALVVILMLSCRIKLTIFYCEIYVFMKRHMCQHLQVG